MSWEKLLIAAIRPKQYQDKIEFRHFDLQYPGKHSDKISNLLLFADRLFPDKQINCLTV